MNLKIPQSYKCLTNQLTKRRVSGGGVYGHVKGSPVTKGCLEACMCTWIQYPSFYCFLVIKCAIQVNNK